MNRILIASVLKPVNDPRMYEKFGISISGLDKVEVHIAGFKPSGEKEEDKPTNLVFHPIFNFNRLSWARAFAPLRFFKLILKVKPQIIIVTTFELLQVSILYKILFGGVLLYDIQENYYRNILFNKTYPQSIRHILAHYSRLIEIISKPFISHYLLAERNYEKEFSFSKGKSLILENKYKNLKSDSSLTKRIKPVEGGPIKILYSGTISEGYGIFDAIDLVEKLYKLNSNITLSIIGYCSNYKTLENLKKYLKDKKYVSLTGGSFLVSHKLIVDGIRNSDFGLLSYQPNPSTENCVPTRLFEYQAHLLPMIIQENKLWKEICEHNNSAIFINYKDVDPKVLLEQMTRQNFYPNGNNSENFWSNEEPKLQALIFTYLK